MSDIKARGRLALTLVEARHQRQRVFPEALFDEYAWDILLILYAAYADGRVMSERATIVATEAPPPVGIRWVNYLVDQKQIARAGEGADGALEITSWAMESMNAWFDHALANLIPAIDGVALE